MEDFRKHAETSGAEILTEMVTKLEKNENHFDVITSTGKELKAKKVVLATGNNYRKLGCR